MSKTIGIITFHRSHNCGSMLQAYATQTILEKMGFKAEIINFSNEGQRQLYQPFQRGLNPKTLVKNIIAAVHINEIRNNDAHYEDFINKFLNVGSGDFSLCADLDDSDYDAVVAGSDQVWNVTIADSDDAYFLPWVTHARKIAYAVSFGARDISKYSSNPAKFADFIRDFDYLSTRENNGRIWIKELTGLDVPVVLDPTLLLEPDDLQKIEDDSIDTPEKFIFYYSPHYDRDINRLVKKISDKYGLPVIGFNAKAFYVKGMSSMGFKLPEYENPSVYLTLMRRATLVITTSFHGTIFSTLYGKDFWTIKNGGMFGDDDRVLTLTGSLDLNDRLIPIEFDPNRNYLAKKDYTTYVRLREDLRDKTMRYLKQATRGL